MQWTAVILCAAAIAINYLDRSTSAIANPQIRAEFHMSGAQFGALQSVWSLAYAIAKGRSTLSVQPVDATQA
jgi:sugar phosphate permease